MAHGEPEAGAEQGTSGLPPTSRSPLLLPRLDSAQPPDARPGLLCAPLSDRPEPSSLQLQSGEPAERVPVHGKIKLSQGAVWMSCERQVPPGKRLLCSVQALGASLTPPQELGAQLWAPGLYLQAALPDCSGFAPTVSFFAGTMSLSLLCKADRPFSCEDHREPQWAVTSLGTSSESGSLTLPCTQPGGGGRDAGERFGGLRRSTRWRGQGQSHSLEVRLSSTNGAIGTCAHVPLAKACHMAMPEVRGGKQAPRPEAGRSVGKSPPLVQRVPMFAHSCLLLRHLETPSAESQTALGRGSESPPRRVDGSGSGQDRETRSLLRARAAIAAGLSGACRAPLLPGRPSHFLALPARLPRSQAPLVSEEPSPLPPPAGRGGQALPFVLRRDARLWPIPCP